MKPRMLFLVAAPVVLVSSVLAQEATPAKPKKVFPVPPIFLSSSDMKWVDLDPAGAPGVKIADLWGNHAKGAYGALIKLPAGFMTPLHTHTHPMKVIFLSGDYIQAPEGKPEVHLGPGSYMYQPGGNYRHTTSCAKSGDCEFFVESNGPFDLKPVKKAE
jgi:anti-sigma factor ChrR (cupin superfamily)